jgi:hypothetical protein
MAGVSRIKDGMPLSIDEVRFGGGSLQRGFWLYSWEVTADGHLPMYYVGRIGDSSSTNAQSPFNRMGQHLGFAENSNMLRRHLIANGAVPEQSVFRLSFSWADRSGGQHAWTAGVRPAARLGGGDGESARRTPYFVGA